MAARRRWRSGVARARRRWFRGVARLPQDEKRGAEERNALSEDQQQPQAGMRYTRIGSFYGGHQGLSLAQQSLLLMRGGRRTSKVSGAVSKTCTYIKSALMLRLTERTHPL